MTAPTTPDPAGSPAATTAETNGAPTIVLVHGGFEVVEGEIVGGVRDPDGQWDLDGVFTVRTEDGELVRVHGCNCITEVL